MSLTGQIAQLVPSTEAEGPGRRFALWFQGCPLRCPGCCNPEFLPFSGGVAMTLEDLLLLVPETIEGLSLLGGEPFAREHVGFAGELASICRSRGLSVMIYSGFTLEELQARHDPATDFLLGSCDLLVDGPYLREFPETQRRWIGSSNQRIHFLTDRYSPDDPCWTRKNTLEIRLRDAEISVNGFPAPGRESLWKPRWTRTGKRGGS